MDHSQISTPLLSSELFELCIHAFSFLITCKNNDIKGLKLAELHAKLTAQILRIKEKISRNCLKKVGQAANEDK